VPSRAADGKAAASRELKFGITLYECATRTASGWLSSGWSVLSFAGTRSARQEGLHPYRAIGGYRHHFHPGRDAAAGVEHGQGEGSYHPLHQQLEADWGCFEPVL